MISHKHKCIFIHIPKCAGSSITNFFFPDFEFNIFKPNYEVLFGWCPKRKIHLQHATAKQMLETGLVTKEQWNKYYKFTFVRNPWDRAYSDYLWMQKELNVIGSFRDFLMKKGIFYKYLTDDSNIKYRGDHLLRQTDYFDFTGKLKVDFIGRFEDFSNDINEILSALNIDKTFNFYINKSNNRQEHYSKFYNFKNKKCVSKIYEKDISLLNYKFDEKKTIVEKLNKMF